MVGNNRQLYSIKILMKHIQSLVHAIAQVASSEEEVPEYIALSREAKTEILREHLPTVFVASPLDGKLITAFAAFTIVDLPITVEGFDFKFLKEIHTK